MEEYIQNSILFKGSKYKDRIFAASQDPINKELIRQVGDFVEYVKEPDGDIVEKDESTTHIKPSEGSAGGGGGSFSGDFDSEFDDIDDEEFSEDIGEDGVFDSESEDIDIDVDGDELDIEETEDEVESSTSINASTYVTIESVSQAVNEIPGMLNLVDTTSGVTHAILKGGTDNEVWIYYNSDIDINSVLQEVNAQLAKTGYYFLEFNRVARNENAIVFSISWVSSYFSTSQLAQPEEVNA